MIDVETINFNPVDGLIPACIQDYQSMLVLMIGYMNKQALELTIASGYVTFYSRSKQRLWTKGESSGHSLKVINLSLDCDQDALLIFAENAGPTCHLGTTSCFADAVLPPLYWLWQLGDVIASRKHATAETSYTATLMTSGVQRIAQKVGEEGVEVALAAVVGTNEELSGEVVDLLYHVLVLLQAKEIRIDKIANIVRERGRTSDASVC